MWCFDNINVTKSVKNNKKRHKKGAICMEKEVVDLEDVAKQLNIDVERLKEVLLISLKTLKTEDTQ